MYPEKAEFEYPFSKKLVLFSFFLVVVSIGVSLYVLTDSRSILLFLLYTLALSGVFFVLKLRLYLMKGSEEFINYGEGEERFSKRLILILLFILFLGLFTPFFLLLFFEPSGWFLAITGFIAGINIPEVILYLYLRRKGK